MFRKDSGSDATFRKQVRSWFEANLPRELRGRTVRPPPADLMVWYKLLSERGWIAPHWPKEHGGMGATLSEQIIIAQELGRLSAPHLPLQGVNHLGPILMRYGTHEQKQRHLPPILRGDVIWAQGYSEPGSGSDLASLRTKGERDGDDWVINGQKIWTSDAQNADWMFCLVRTEPDAPKHDGISYILIDMKTPGLTVRPLRQMTGTADFNEVFLENVRVPFTNLVGDRGKGWIVSRSTLKHERALIGSASMSRRVFDGVALLAQFTNVRGRPAIQDAVIRDRLVQLEAKLLASEYHGYRQLTMSARGEEPGMAALVSKLSSTTLGYDVAKLAMDVMGDRGALAPGEPEAPGMGMLVSAYMWSLGVLIAGGTANIQRNIIAERGLGLPRDAAASAGRK